jgi:hypothetical protein
MPDCFDIGDQLILVNDFAKKFLNHFRRKLTWILSIDNLYSNSQSLRMNQNLNFLVCSVHIPSLVVRILKN